jgi:hypothetical protein
LILFDQFFHEKAEMNKILCEDFEFSSHYGSVITAIHVTDLTMQQDGGKVKITYGGVGYTYVKLQLVSECGKQLLLNVEIFGT